MKGKKILALLTGAMLCVSMLAGCGGEPVSNSSEPQTQSGEDSAQDSGGESMEPSDEVQVSTDPLEMITEGYYSFTYSVEGMDDMCAFFHFYEEQPVLGSVFYAGFAWNQITYAGTYTVEEKERDYHCAATREDAVAEPAVFTDGTAPYTVTFYDFKGNELGVCGFDGNVLYNDSPVSGTGAENCFFYHDTDPASKYMATYEGEIGLPYLDFVAQEEATSTLTLYHNGRYLDMVNMMIEGTWSMAEGTDGYEYTLKPDSDSDTAAVIAVSADETAGVYTPAGGEGISMSNKLAGGPKAVYEITGETPVPGQEFNGALIATAYDDGTITLIVDVFGTQMEVDKGFWSEQDGELAINFNGAGALVTTTGDSGRVLQYKASTEMLGDVDAALSVAEAAGDATVQFTMTGQAPMGDDLVADVTGTLYSDGTVSVYASVYGVGMDIDQGTWTMDNYVFTFTFDNAGELVSEFGDAGALLKYHLESETGIIDGELVLAAAE